jgi:hypothetical protein
MSGFPYYKVKSYGVWDAEAELSGLIINNFKARTKCGGRQQVFTIMEFASDYIPPHTFDNIVFNEVENDAFGWFMDPPERWANVDDCIDFPCTAPSNLLFHFENTQFTGSQTPGIDQSTFQIISDTENVSSHISDCTYRAEWNAW